MQDIIFHEMPQKGHKTAIHSTYFDIQSRNIQNDKTPIFFDI